MTEKEMAVWRIYASGKVKDAKNVWYVTVYSITGKPLLIREKVSDCRFLDVGIAVDTYVAGDVHFKFIPASFIGEILLYEGGEKHDNNTT